MNRSHTLAAVLATAALGLTACGSDGSGSAPSSSPSSSSTTVTVHNQQDVAFASDMIPHHQQAVRMARMAEAGLASAEVRKLAADIEAAQGPEIEQMSGWLRAWGQDVPSGSMSGMDGMGEGDEPMAGMMSEGDLARLDDARGAAFDRMWLRGMIGHHEGAVAMAETEIAQGRNGDAVALARDIRASQSRELRTMEALLAP